MLAAQEGTHLNKSLATGIQTIGFRRWYERELLSGHAHLVLLLLAVVGVMACLEVMPTLTAAERLLYGCYVLACAAIGVCALRRYLYLLMRAEAIANQANCPGCGAYGRLRLGQGPHRSDVTLVQCRGCGQEWTIDE
jgi:hypothetical protein